MKKILAFALSAIVESQHQAAAQVETRVQERKEKVVRVGVTGTDGDAWEILKKKLKKKGLRLNWWSSPITQRQIKR